MVFCHLLAGFIGLMISPVPETGSEEMKTFTRCVAGVVSLPNYAITPVPARNLLEGKAGTQRRHR